MASIITALTGKQSRVQFIQEPTGVVITMDASVKETHTRQSPPTEFPIENGQTISDHIIIKPFDLEIQGIISDYPISLINSLVSTAVTAILPPVGVQVLAAGAGLFSALSQSKSPSVAAYEQILGLQDAKLPFDVITTLKRYSSMFIKSITVPREASNGNILEFTVSLVQLIIVSPSTVNISVFGAPDVSASEADAGEQAAISYTKAGAQGGIKSTLSAFNSITGGSFK